MVNAEVAATDWGAPTSAMTKVSARRKVFAFIVR